MNYRRRNNSTDDVLKKKKMKKEEPSNKGQEYCDVGKGSREVAVSENEGGRV